MIAAAVLNIILFFKIWKMTNDVARIKDSVKTGSNMTPLFFFLTGENEKFKDALNKDLYRNLCDVCLKAADAASNLKTPVELYDEAKEKILSQMALKYEKIGAEVPERFRQLTYEQLLVELNDRS
jgi:hypothetical protein